MKHFFLLLTALVASTTLWAADFEVDGIAYNKLGGDSVEVTYKSPDYSGDITIPATVTYESTTYRVTSIRDYVFYKCTSLTSITIPNSVTSIGEGAFEFCSFLSSITIPNSVTSIGDEAFSGCTSLTSVIIPNSVTSIGNYAFSGCTSLTSITIPNSVISIEYSALSGCTSLTSITIPNSVTSIGGYVFRNCTSLTSITIPNSVTSIVNYAFDNCTSLTSIDVDAANTHYASVDGVLFNYAKDTLIQYPIGNTRTTYAIPNNVASIGEDAFNGCTSLTSITIPNSVTSIGDYAFWGCTSLPVVDNLRYADTYLIEAVDQTLSTYTIKDGTKWIGSSAFFECTSLTSITIGNSVTSIGDDAFYGCYSLTSIDVDAANTHYASVDGVLFNYAKDTLIQYPVGNTRTTYTIPYSVNSIGEWAFYGCSSLTSITIPDSVTSIGESAFDGCDNITSVTWNAKNCNAYNFGSQVETFVFGNEVEVIPDQLCYNMPKFTSITIPNSVIRIGDAAFDGCDNITSVTWNAKNCNAYNFGSQVETFVFGNEVEVIPDQLCYNMPKFTSITIPNSVIRIGDAAFDGCNNITSVTWNAKNCNAYYFGSQVETFTFGNEVEIIPASLCSGMAKLSTITIPNSVTSIGELAFVYCTSLTSLNVGAGNRYYASVDGVLFNYTKDTLIQYPIGNTRTSYTIPNSVTSIGDYAFYSCESLDSVTIGNNVTSIGKGAFYDCTSLISVTIPNGVTSIGEGAFYGCDNITSVTWNAKNCNSHDFGFQVETFTFGNEVEIIPEQLCSGMSKLTSITIPNRVTSIGYRAFSGCDNIDSVTWNAKNCNSHNFGSQVKTFTFGNEVEIIPKRLCSGMSKLTSITIPNNVTSIGEMAFYHCTSISSITIPNSVKSIGYEAFYKCDNIDSVTWNAKNCNAYNFGSQVETFTFGNEVEIIPASLCSGMAKLSTITIPNSVNSIGKWAFDGCDNITSVTWNAKNCNAYNFGSQVETFTFGNEVEIIPKRLCSSMSRLTSITIPNKVTSIGEGAFFRCDSLTSINVDAANTHYASVDGVLFNYAKDTLIQYPIGNTRTSFTIPNSVISIGEGAFYYCHSLTSITIPNSVTSIGDDAFSYCDSLTSITSYAIVPPVCGNDCFYEVDKTIPLYVLAGSKVAYQTADTWKDFTNIKPITFVTTSVNNPLYGSVHGGGLIYDSICTLTAFANYLYCFTQWSDGNTDNPRSFILTQDTTFEAWFDIAKSGTCGDNLTWQYTKGTLAISGTGDMYNYAKDSVPWIYFRDSITNIVIANGATTVGNYAFYGCSLIPNVVMPASITTIGQYAFANCQKLRAITLGLGTILIAENAFAENSKLYEITCYALDPPTANDNSFVNYRATLRVPCSTKSWYTKADVWYKFEDVSCIGAEETTTTTVTITPDETTATITWPTNTDANDYTIEIKKDGIVFCTLTFNAQGQLTNIAFAPGRGTSNDVALAEAVAGGYKFTITCLTPGTTYTYVVDAKNAGGTSIANYTGEFTTTGGTPTAIDRTTFPSGENRGEAVKLIRDGHLLILREGKTYDAQGELVW